jgi:general secretion pathway protein D
VLRCRALAHALIPALIPTLLAAFLGIAASAQQPPPLPAPTAEGEKVQLDFSDVELSAIIDTIARVTGKNFIYDDRVRGKVTIISPSPITVEQAYAVFESVLKVKGFTAVPGPGGVIKIIPIRDAKESNLKTIKDARPSENRDVFVTRLIPLLYINAQDITNTIKPLVSKDASMVAYQPTNTIILTDTASNIRRLLTILEAIDVEIYKEELAVIHIRYADAATLGQQISEIFEVELSAGAASSSTAARRSRSSRRNQTRTTSPVTSTGSSDRVRIITDDRTNSLLVLASRSRLAEIRDLIKELDVPVTGGGRIHVYYLKHADAEELAQTLGALLSGQQAAPRGARSGTTGSGGAQQQAMRSAITALAQGITLTADPGTNALVIQASKEAYETVARVIEQLDVARPQVLVEALIMEVRVGDALELGINWLVELDRNIDVAMTSASDTATQADLKDAATYAILPLAGAGAFAANVGYQSKDGNTTIQAILRASAADGNANIISAPHLLTSDNEEAEIKIGENIPIITNRVNTATGNISGQTTSVAVERHDIGVTLRVTPQISEGETLRLKIFQEISAVTASAEGVDVNQVGPTLTNRKIENTLVVADGATVVVGGLISDVYEDTVVKTPFLGDIPVLGWLFKTTSTKLAKVNLLIFLTPHIVRTPEDLERESIRKREEFASSAGEEYTITETELPEDGGKKKRSPVDSKLRELGAQYPLARMREIEELQAVARAEAEAARAAAQVTGRYEISAGIFRDQEEAAEMLTTLLDRGYDGALLSSEAGGLLLFELRIGPFDTLKESEDTAETLSDAFGLSTSVIIRPLPEEP